MEGNSGGGRDRSARLEVGRYHEKRRARQENLLPDPIIYRAFRQRWLPTPWSGCIKASTSQQSHGLSSMDHLLPGQHPASRGHGSRSRGDRVPSSGVPPDRLEQDRTRQCQTLRIAEIDVNVDSCATILSLGPDGGIAGAAERQKCPELGELASHRVPIPVLMVWQEE